MSVTTLWRSVFVLSVFSVVLAAPGAASAQPKYPRMHEALYELKAARLELIQAADDFGGHRLAAVKATEAAIAQIEIALASAGDPFKGVMVDKQVYVKYKNYPHIHRAIDVLKETRIELTHAKQIFAGHREKALQDVNFAIEQLELALKFAKK
jgi:hypothetical protein